YYCVREDRRGPVSQLRARYEFQSVLLGLQRLRSAGQPRNREHQEGPDTDHPVAQTQREKERRRNRRRSFFFLTRSRRLLFAERERRLGERARKRGHRCRLRGQRLEAFGQLAQLHVYVLIPVHTRTGRNEVTDDDVLLEAEEVVLGAADRCIGKNPSGFLERSSRNKRLRRERGLGNTEQQ